jgi:hypothetical protein
MERPSHIWGQKLAATQQSLVELNEQRKKNEEVKALLASKSPKAAPLAFMKGFAAGVFLPAVYGVATYAGDVQGVRSEIFRIQKQKMISDILQETHDLSPDAAMGQAVGIERFFAKATPAQTRELAASLGYTHANLPTIPKNVPAEHREFVQNMMYEKTPEGFTKSPDTRIRHMDALVAQGGKVDVPHGGYTREQVEQALERMGTYTERMGRNPHGGATKIYAKLLGRQAVAGLRKGVPVGILGGLYGVAQHRQRKKALAELEGKPLSRKKGKKKQKGKKKWGWRR